MLEHFFRKRKRIQAIRGGPHGVLLEGFAEELRQTGYIEKAARARIRAAEHLLQWTEREGIPITDVTEELLKPFRQHLERCQCPGFGPVRLDLFRGDRLFLDHLRSTGLLTTSSEPHQDPPLLVAFRQWMRQERGTGDSTLYQYSLRIQALLAHLGDDPRRFDAQNLRQFVLETHRHEGWGVAKKCTTALRMFLRFLVAEGQCATGLDEAIPVLARWRCSSLPRYLLPEDVERVIALCNPSTPAGRRNRAILLLLARMGLRAGDIVKLRFGDIDWREASVRVSGKGRRETQLPLTQEVGDALVAYLKAGSLRNDTEMLFLCARAPYRVLRSHTTVSSIVARAMRRAGISCPVRGAAHMFRHAAATAMLRHGVSLQEIAKVLRHRSVETTQIYAKVDVTALQRITQPWPEVQPC
jgi:site-specific recombinase XerD